MSERDREVYLGYPKIFVTPSPYKDSQGGEGGQRQGRLAFQDPAVQTFNPRLKKCERSRWKGGSILSFDLSQIELRTAAVVSGDSSMLSIYLADGDIHADMCVRIFGEHILVSIHFKSGDREKDPRQWSKQINFLILYRGSARRMQATLLKECGIVFPLSRCKEIVNSFPDLRPGLWNWQERYIASVNEKGYAEVPITGHTRSFEGGTSFHKPQEMVNFPIQFIAAITMLRIQSTLIRLLSSPFSKTPPAVVYCNRYDASYIDAKPSAVSEVIDAIPEAVHQVETNGYWADIQAHYGHTCPLKYEMETP